MIIQSAPPSPEAEAMLKALQTAVDNCLSRKRKLGQYAVIWHNYEPLLMGPDAPRTDP